MRAKKIENTDEANKDINASKLEKIKYWDAPEVKEMATRLITGATNFTIPTNTPICYAFIDKSNSYWGKASLMSPFVNFLTGYQFSIVINHEQWLLLTDNQREALVFHELCHLFYDAEKNKFSIADHELEEFPRVVTRYGLWRESVKNMADSIQKRLTIDEEKK